MDIDQLEYVADDFEEGEHEKLDEDIRQIFTLPAPALAPYILAHLATRSGGRLLSKYHNLRECETLLDSKSNIRDMILDGSKNGYKNLRLLKLLRPEEPVLKDDEHLKHPRSTSAVALGWEGSYVGGAADALWAHVQTWFNKDSRSGSGRSYHAKYSAIVQSSGMGKSRTVDQMSRSHFVIPVNLRGPESSGFPPRDKAACDYLLHSSSQRDAFLRSCSFLHALFLQTTLVVREMKKGPAAEKFWSNMKDGMQHQRHGQWRTTFYETVETGAKEVYDVYSKYFPDDAPSTDEGDRLLCSCQFPLRKICRTLCKALEDQSVGGKQPRKRQKIDPKSQSSQRPSVLLAFDEAHILTRSMGDEKSSRFGELRRAIRGLMDESLFTLFLSTSGALFSVTPTPSHDLSARTINEGNVMLPFNELGFDQLATHVDFSETVNLSRVTSEEHFTSYGRPLWRPYYNPSDKDRIINFAAGKLLGGIAYQLQTLSLEQKLACLARRIPIEFLSASHVSQISDAEREQVNAHMRVVLKVDESLETMVTVSSSEPILSEAAYYVMSTQSRKSFHHSQVLQEILKGFAVHKGDLGELILALLFTVARDNAVGSADNFGRPLNGDRWCSITALLGSLFCTPTSTSDDHVNVITSHGWHFTRQGTTPLKSTLADTFKDSKVYFTHFIKVHQHAIVQVEFLMHLMVRGAAILCANNQPNIDGIIPFLLEGDEIKRDNIGVIMFQVENDANYTHSPEADYVRKMNPRVPEIISSSADIPIIRLFFALSANTPALKLVEHEPSNTTSCSYSTYDFCVTGLSPKFLVPVADEEAAWQSILQTSHRWEKIYAGGGQPREGLRRSTNPGAGVAIEFWMNWCKNVPS